MRRSRVLGTEDVQIAFVREILALFSGRMAGLMEQLFELHDLSLGKAFPGSFDLVSRNWRCIVRGHARNRARARQGRIHV